MKTKREEINRNQLEFNKLKNTHIDYFEEIIKPYKLIEKLPITDNVQELIIETRNSISNIINGTDKRMLFIVGPCSIHNIEEAKEYALLLKLIADEVRDKILIVMRVYFEKPRTTIGWKGLINDPNLDGSYDVNKGLHLARELLLYINGIGLPCGYEILDTITPQYICDLISWGAIGARTTESQVHRQLVSGLSMPVGFKNGTGGTITIAADAIKSAKFPHCFMGITYKGEPAICKTIGNNDCHIILRGGASGPNYSTKYIEETEIILETRELNPKIMVDCSHGNSCKIHTNQKFVLDDIITQKLDNNKSIIGIMLESNINSGNQKLVTKDKLIKGVSITDACIDIDTTRTIIINSYNKL